MSMKRLQEFIYLMEAPHGLSDIEQQCNAYFSHVPRCVIGVMFLNPSNPQAFSILRGMDYYNARSGMDFHFFIPGQANGANWEHRPQKIYESFNANTFTECIRELEKSLPDYHYSEKPELLFFDVEYGNPDWKKSLVLQLDEIEKSSGQDFETIFQKIYQSFVVVNTTSIITLGSEIGIDVAKRSLLDSLKHMLKRIPLVSDLVSNSRGIYFK